MNKITLLGCKDRHFQFIEQGKWNRSAHYGTFQYKDESVIVGYAHLKSCVTKG